VVGNLSSLRILNLSSNALSGAIFVSLGHLCHLCALDLSYNTFSGKLSAANLSSCTSLVDLHLYSNHLHGGLPSKLGNKLARFEKLILF
jgi:hypothetical protein